MESCQITSRPQIHRDGNQIHDDGSDAYGIRKAWSDYGKTPQGKQLIHFANKRTRVNPIPIRHTSDYRIQFLFRARCHHEKGGRTRIQYGRNTPNQQTISVCGKKIPLVQLKIDD